MNGDEMQLALRDLRTLFTDKVTLGGLAGVALVMGISGPFGTLDRFELGARLAYWAMLVPATYAAGYLGSRLVHPHLPRGPRALRIALAATGSTALVGLVLSGVNGALGIALGGAREIILGLGAVYVICAVIETLGYLLAGKQDKARAPAILKRIGLDKRAPLVALSVEDHYVRIRTTKGETIVLMRLSDAIAETVPLQGLQVHRSHWVALDAVQGARRRGDGAELQMVCGADVPVSRANIPAIREAGLLPR